MARYYTLVAGLPHLTVDADRLTQSQEEYYAELLETLTPKDQVQLEYLRLGDQNKELLRLVEEGVLGDEEIEEGEEEADDVLSSSLPVADLRRVVRQARKGGKCPKVKGIAPYMCRFVYETYYTPIDADEDALEQASSPLSPADRLTELYYEAMEEGACPFVSAWLRFDQTIRNVLAIHTARKLGWPAEQYVVGRGAIEQQLLTSTAADFGLSEEVPQIRELVQLAGMNDIAHRERQIDLIKWQWLDDWTFVKVFDLDNVLAYYLRLGIVERWLRLEREQGERVFRQIVSDLKSESNTSLQQFKKSTNMR